MGGGMFDVDDTLQLGAPRPASAARASAAKPAEAKAKVVARAIRVTPRAGETVGAITISSLLLRYKLLIARFENLFASKQAKLIRLL